MKIRTIVTGATGMVGEGVLLECLKHPDVEQVLVINRKPGGLSHPKLREIIHSDQTTERYLGSKQKIQDAVNDHIGVEPTD
jgi:N-acetyl-gamma-glutamylphosphate reductase